MPPAGTVPADKAREHLIALKDAGISIRQISAACGLSVSGLHRVVAGTTKTLMPENERLILSLGENLTPVVRVLSVDAEPARAHVTRIVENAEPSLVKVAQKADINITTLRNVMNGKAERIDPEVHRRIMALSVDPAEYPKPEKVLAAPVTAHLKALRADGVTWFAVQEITGLPRATIRRLSKQPNAMISPNVAQTVLAVTLEDGQAATLRLRSEPPGGKPMTSALRASLYLNALITRGVSLSQIVEVSGLALPTIRKVAKWPNATILTETAQAILNVSTDQLTFDPQMDATPVKEHLRALKATGTLLAHVALVADVEVETLRLMLRDDWKTVATSIGAKVIAVTPEDQIRVAPMISAEDIRRHLLVLRQSGFSIPRVAEESGLNRYTLERFMKGEFATIRRVNAAKIMNISPGVTARSSGGRIDSTGTRRRIEALMASGWSRRELGRQLGMLGEIKSYHTSQVIVRVAEDIARLYDRLENVPGPSARTRTWALNKGYLPPALWPKDRIDDPTFQPLRPLTPRQAHAFRSHMRKRVS